MRVATVHKLPAEPTQCRLLTQGGFSTAFSFWKFLIGNPYAMPVRVSHHTTYPPPSEGVERYNELII